MGCFNPNVYYIGAGAGQKNLDRHSSSPLTGACGTDATEDGRTPHHAYLPPYEPAVPRGCTTEGDRVNRIFTRPANILAPALATVARARAATTPRPVTMTHADSNRASRRRAADRPDARIRPTSKVRRLESAWTRAASKPAARFASNLARRDLRRSHGG